ncbi:helix-turn-helix transcriptional regulator [Rathayibacter sp. VKM Ac-2856]|uniref:helix-turn-helix domain-containing protein n=1 Tax=unclassified Rathayibacter TaxID=2609250 RepID=UPI0015667B4E|nr:MULTISPECIES: helix-turn-helix transcriptional regulator [unclassified Rathayibacter]NQX06015.1 helix-turn-helix transcriptional regulator [Rathayibacter sp. VKM Ac-2858]NQX21035.1 helix-turn-helix transcriptional regulator [Rathayibacter sp. VKM Ac-2856]
MTSQFWDDLRADLKDPEFARAYAAESIRVATIDAVVDQLDVLRESAELSKAALARAVGVDPSVVRRLFSSASPNPTLGTLAEVAAALGMKVALVPMEAEERARITEPMLASAR